MTVDSLELKQILVESADIAAKVGQPETTTHLLLAVTSTSNRARLLLEERRISFEKLVGVSWQVRPETADAKESALEMARRVADDCKSPEADSVHLLVALTRIQSCMAYQMLAACGINIQQLRLKALSYYLGGCQPRSWKKLDEEKEAAKVSAEDILSGKRGIRGRGKKRQPSKKAAPLSSAPPAFALSKIPQAVVPSASARPARISAIPHSVGHASAIAPAAQGNPPPRIEATIERAEVVIPPPPLTAVRPQISIEGKREAKRTRYSLDPQTAPVLCELGRNLTELAFEGKLDPVIGRTEEIEQVIDILGKRRSNNPCLLGDPGVGKTAVVEGTAQALVALAEKGALNRVRLIVELDMGSLLAGTQLRGAFSEKLKAIKDEVRRAEGSIVVFIDEIHTLIGAGATEDGPQDAANELKSAMARGEFPCIGATTDAEFKKYIEKDSAIQRRFTPVRVEEPSVEDTVAILQGIVGHYSLHHGVSYTPQAVEAAASMADKFISDRFLPDKAITVIDLAGSRARREGRPTVGVREIARTVSRLTGVPEERLTISDSKRLLRLEKDLSKRVIGHEEVIARLAQVVRRNYAGFSSKRPMGSFLFLGPTGVGKTELARALAETLFGRKDSLVRLDMSECADPTGVSRLIGTAPGYVGFGEGGMLTDAVRRRPSSVVLFDEIEKAHREVLMLLLQILEEGEVSDSRGRHVDFSASVVILTSNLGAEAFARQRSGIGFGGGSETSDGSARERQAEKALEAARGTLAPELWNRLDEKLCFLPLTRDEMSRVAAVLLDESSRRLSASQDIDYAVTREAIDYLLDHGGYDALLGARPMRQTIQRLIEVPLADAIIAGEFQRGERIAAEVREGKLAFRRLKR